jgi:hypothetical protein
LRLEETKNGVRVTTLTPLFAGIMLRFVGLASSVFLSCIRAF